MAKVFIPAQMRKFCSGHDVAVLDGTTVGELLEELERCFPGVRALLIEAGELRPSIAVSVDGEIATAGLLEPVGPNSEVHFIPAIGGGLG